MNLRSEDNIISFEGKRRSVSPCRCGRRPTYKNYESVGYPLHVLACKCGLEADGKSLDQVADAWQQKVAQRSAR